MIGWLLRFAADGPQVNLGSRVQAGKIAMTTSESKAELHRLMLEAAEAGLSLSDIRPIFARLKIDPRQLVNELALAVANGFYTMNLDFGFCSEVMNGKKPKPRDGKRPYRRAIARLISPCNTKPST